MYALPSSPCTAYTEAVHVPPAETRTVIAPLCHFVVCRADLPRGVQAANLVHAAGNSSPGNLSDHTIAVVLSVPDERALAAVAQRLARAGIPFVRVVEDDPPYTGQLMAIGCAPGRKEVIGRELRDLKLLK